MPPFLTEVAAGAAVGGTDVATGLAVGAVVAAADVAGGATVGVAVAPQPGSSIMTTTTTRQSVSRRLDFISFSLRE